jgi:hypothetical protein
MPLVVDPQCLDVNFNVEERVPAKVMEQFAEIVGAAQLARRTRRSAKPPHIGTLLSRLIQSVEAIEFWTSGSALVDSSNRCDFAAQAITRYLDMLGESDCASSGGGDDRGEGEFRQRRQRQQRERGRRESGSSMRGSELELQPAAAAAPSVNGFR